MHLVSPRQLDAKNHISHSLFPKFLTSSTMIKIVAKCTSNHVQNHNHQTELCEEKYIVHTKKRTYIYLKQTHENWKSVQSSTILYYYYNDMQTLQKQQGVYHRKHYIATENTCKAIGFQYQSLKTMSYHREYKQTCKHSKVFIASQR